MKRRTRAQLALAAALCALSAAPAFGSSAECARSPIEADGAVEERWPELLGRVREAFEARDDIDRCARVRLTLHGDSVLVVVTLPDGRLTERSAARQEDVVPTVEALLLVPSLTETAASDPSAPEAAPVPVGKTSEPPRSSVGLRPIAEVAPDGRDRAAIAPSSRPRSGARLRIELSALAGARIGDGQVSAGLGALSLLDVSGWLAGFEGRADRYRSRSGARPSGALELAALGGRRFAFENVAVDAIAGLAATLQGTATFATQSTSNGSAISESNSSTVPRALVASRLNFGVRSTWSAFVGLDGEIGPSRAGGSDLPGASRLPFWTFGITVGATVGTP